MAHLIEPIVVATLAVLAGTVAGRHLLSRIPEAWFRRILACVLAALGALMVLRGWTE